jgi:hypothetical protein
MVVGTAVFFGLIVLWPETTDIWYLNDSGVHRSLVGWAADRVRSGHLPFDGWYPYLSMGSSRFHHYQSLPHILTGSLSVLTGAATYRWSLYLMLATWPVAVYAGARLLGLGRWPAAAAAAISPLLSSASGLGYEWGSYVWRGAGTWAQLWGMWLLPLAWGTSWRAIATGRRLWLAALVLGLTICAHLLTGYLAVWSLAVFVLVRPTRLWRRLARSVVVFAGALAAAAWMLVPLLTDAGWTINDEFSRGTIYYDSFGARRILTWLATGQLLDDGRLPVITVLMAVGVALAVFQSRRRAEPRALLGLFGLSLVLFFGRTTLGPVADLVPGGEDLFWRRFVSGVHLAAIYLAGMGATWLVSQVVVRWRRADVRLVPAWTAAGLVAIVLIAWPVIERFQYERRGAAWISDQADAEATDGVGFEALVEVAKDRGDGRIFAGMRRQDIADYRISSVPGYAALLNLDADGVGFTRPTWSLASPAEFRFDLGSPGMRDLFGVRYVLRPDDVDAPSAEEIDRIGRHVLSEYPDNGYLEVVDTIAPIVADRRNLGEQTASYLTSGLPERKLVPTIAFGGRAPETPTLGPNEEPAGSPGEVIDSHARPVDGEFAGTVSLDRTAVVMLKASFDPRWKAFVDGEEFPVQMLAPAFVGVAVPPGQHQVLFVYSPYPSYLPLFLAGALVIFGIWAGEIVLRRPASEPAVGKTSVGGEGD